MKLEKMFKNKIEAKHIYTIVMVVVYLYLIGRCINQYAFGNGIYGCKLEFLLIVIFSFIIYIISFLESDIFNKKHRKKRENESFQQLKRNCILKSCFLSLVITTFLYLLIAYEDINVDFYNMIPNQEVLSIIGLAALLLIIFFIISYFITFYSSKNKFAKVK